MKSLAFFLWTALFSFLPMPGATNAFADAEQNSAYARMLDSLASDTPAGKIHRLQNFVRNNPKEERAFLKLLQQYQFLQKPSDALTFFSKELSGIAEAQRNRHWMLAKLASCDTLSAATNEARDNFALALRDSFALPPPALLYDFIVFCHENSERLDHPNLIRRHLSRPEDLTLALGFYSYLNEDYQQAEVAIKRLSPSLKNTPLVLFVLSDCFLREENKVVTEQFAQADSIARYGLILALQNNDKEWQARFWAQLGDIAYSQKNDEQAHASYKQAHKFANTANDLFSLQRSLGGLGKIHHLLVNYTTAESLYLKAIPIAERICAYRDLSLLYSNYCQLLTEL
ncbi:MAG: hypothetical protein AAB354_13045 [candidate division KSB1 bacterium]